MEVVTGAFSYTGQYITRRLLAEGVTVRTLTGHPERHRLFEGRVEAVPFNFHRPELLLESLRGATTLYNTYWIRFPRGVLTFHQAVENTRALLRAAREAGVQRIVHVSIANASEDSPLPYFRAKGLVERAILEEGLSYAILRPTVVFGPEDILINNIAWLLRRFPIFPVAGSGAYLVQPVFVDDVARLAVQAGRDRSNVVVDVVGPERYTFTGLVRLIAAVLGVGTRLVHVPPALVQWAARLVGYLVRDRVLTREELAGLMAGLLTTEASAQGEVRISRWLEEHRHTLGTRYASETRTHYR